MSDGNPHDFSDTANIFRSLRSATCPCCTGKKSAGKSFCWSCYRKLPKALQNALYDAQGYADTFREALQTLTAGLIRIADETFNRR